MALSDRSYWREGVRRFYGTDQTDCTYGHKIESPYKNIHATVDSMVAQIVENLADNKKIRVKDRQRIYDAAMAKLDDECELWNQVKLYINNAVGEEVAKVRKERKHV